MEKKRSSWEKMQELGIFEKWQANTDAHTAEMRILQRCTAVMTLRKDI